MVSLRCKRWIIILREYEIRIHEVIEKIALFSSERVLYCLNFLYALRKLADNYRPKLINPSLLF